MVRIEPSIRSAGCFLGVLCQFKAEHVGQFADGLHANIATGQKEREPALGDTRKLVERVTTTMEFYVGRNAEAAADVLWEAISKAGDINWNRDRRSPMVNRSRQPQPHRDTAEPSAG